MPVNSTTDQRVARLRRRLRRSDIILRKSRVRSPHLYDHGGYQLIDAERNAIISGPRFELGLDDVEDWLEAHAAS